LQPNVHYEVPSAFLDRMARLLRDEYPAFLASYGAQPSVGLRVNTLKLTPEAFRETAPFDLAPVPWCAAGFALNGNAEPGKHPYHAAGLYYLQDPAAMAVAELLDPQPGERVLDLSAAPGGKATHIASLMRNKGLLVANEIHGKRVWDLAENLERWGARNAAITVETPERLATRLEGFFDRVLVDAPCSGEGMFRRSAAARAEWAPELIQGCALRQSAILEQAARMVRTGGVLAYSTCTFAPEEDEGTLARFLRQHPEFQLAKPARRPGFSEGRPDWVETGAGLPELRRAVRLWPQTGPGYGHFIAVMWRAGASSPADTPPARPEPADWLPAQVLALYRAFCREHLTAAPVTERLALAGTYLYALPSDSPDLTGMRFVHPGWWLGTIKKKRFEPSHALAMALAPSTAQRTLDLSAGSAEVLAYLRGGSLPAAGQDGWTLVTVDGFPVGWGKRVKGIVKSHYPKGLRRN
jgi:16S rRNA C967 or C1407 C5-methylase (RsmB/RsmF family)/NOL1/NOP2/fmu family ribosome biogenesis protein